MQANSTTVHAGPLLSERQRTIAFATVLTAVVLEVADSTIVNTALPAIRIALDASSSQMQWIVAGYLLSLGSLLLLGGKLGDAFGHRRVFLWSVAAFVLTSVLCGLAQDAGQLVAARILQGAAGAIMAPQGMAIIQLLFTPLERVAKLAYFGLIVGLAAIVGPILGGLLIEMNLLDLGWRVIFLLNLPVGLGAIVVGRMVLPHAGELSPPRVDPLGALLFAASFGAMLFALTHGAEQGWSILVATLGLAGAATAAFAWQRARRRRAAGKPSIVEPDLFRLPTFAWATCAAFAFAAASIGFLLVFAVALQQGIGLSPLDTALVHIPFGAGVMLGVGVLVPRLLPGMGKRLPLAGGSLMLLGESAALLIIAGGDGGSALLLAVLFVAGLGMGTLSGPLGPIVVADVDRSMAGTASATYRTSQQLGGAIGIAVVGAAYFAVRAGHGPLSGLPPAAAVVAVLVLLALLAVSRLPARLFVKG